MEQNNEILEINLNIANFLIKILFYRIKRDYMRHHIVKILQRRYASFSVDKPSLKPDFIIKVNPQEHLELFFNKVKKAGYLKIYVKESHNVISTFYNDANHYGFLLLEIITQLLAKTGGFIFHQSSVFFEDGLVLFSGPSNAGKTTAAKLMSKTYNPISSDNGIIKFEDGDFYLYQTPFFDSLRIKPSNQRYKIGKVYFLNKSNRFFIKELTDKKKVLEKVNEQILQHIPYSKKQFKNIVNFVYKKQFAELFFAKNSKKLLQLVKEDFIKSVN
jgi:hypothetical protein